MSPAKKTTPTPAEAPAQKPRQPRASQKAETPAPEPAKPAARTRKKAETPAPEPAKPAARTRKKAETPAPEPAKPAARTRKKAETAPAEAPAKKPRQARASQKAEAAPQPAPAKPATRTRKKAAAEAPPVETASIQRDPNVSQATLSRVIGALKAMPAAAPVPEQTRAPEPTRAPLPPRYDPANIETKWQSKWETDKLYRSVIDPTKKKHYALTMLPYPSGNLHIGHWYAMTPSDARARWMRMRGYNVLFPMGFDAFGLPAENAAIRDGIHPLKRTYANITYMRQQLRSMGTMFDWEREAVSCDPEFYKWTQWFFNQMFRHGLAYKKLAPVDYCPHCNTTLAREQVWGDDRHCERCKTPVIKKELDQWYFRTTKYADELLNFEGLDWPDKVRDMQTHWIGRSEGARVTFHSGYGDPIDIFTTRPDTLFGATFMVLAPEHPLVATLTTPEHRAEVEAYVAAAARQTDMDREATSKDKTGVFIGAHAINPINQERIPIWIADYVLMSYGTGAIMAVPAHDERDFAFASKYRIPIRTVIAPPDWDGQPLAQAYAGPGKMVNSGEFDGTSPEEAKRSVIRWLEERGYGRGAVTYRLRDWTISRQRYWGSPIAVVYCKSCGTVPVPDDQLPVLLPEDVAWLPTGQSPLKLHPTWKNTTCPKCGEPAERDTDTMDTFMCSSWYHLRYLSPQRHDVPFDSNEYDYWMPVDTYTGGAEHATMHLIYTRFFHKALRDMGIAKGPEPMTQLRNQGQILGPDGQRMSKSRGNVIDPDEQVRKYGADTVRAYMMFGYQWTDGGPWSDGNIQGVVRWLNRLWTIVVDTKDVHRAEANPAAVRILQRVIHQSIRKATDDFDKFQFNTVVSTLMEFTNALYKHRDALAGTEVWREAVRTVLLLAAPIVPHITEELWAFIDQPYSIHKQAWPSWNADLAAEDLLTVVVQINGKVRDRVHVPPDTSDDDVKAAALATEGARRFMDGKPARNVLYVKGRLINIVV